MIKAQEAIEKARALADEDQPDQAYVQYLRASEMTVNIIPHHPDYRVTVSQRPGWYKQFADLMMVRPLKTANTIFIMAMADWKNDRQCGRNKEQWTTLNGRSSKIT